MSPISIGCWKVMRGEILFISICYGNGPQYHHHIVSFMMEVQSKIQNCGCDFSRVTLPDAGYEYLAYRKIQ